MLDELLETDLAASRAYVDWLEGCVAMGVEDIVGIVRFEPGPCPWHKDWITLAQEAERYRRVDPSTFLPTTRDGGTMSRHTFTGLDGENTVAIGWDRPLETFFVQVLAPHPTLEGEQEILFWKGTDLRELPTAADALTAARLWALLPIDLGATLETDRMKTLGNSDGEHQAAVKRRLFPN